MQKEKSVDPIGLIWEKDESKSYCICGCVKVHFLPHRIRINTNLIKYK